VSCADCARAHEHCHGTWVTHVDGDECTDEECRLPEEAHEHGTDCADATCCLR
jgi:hypothetical protein